MWLLSVQESQAQFEKGKGLFSISTTPNISSSGGNVFTFGFGSEKRKSDNSGIDEDVTKTFGLNLTPRFGLFVADNLSLGIDLNTAFSRDKSDGGERKFTQGLLAVGPFARYYFVSDKFLPFVELNSSIGTIKGRSLFTGSPSHDTEFTQSLISYGGGVGVSAVLSDHILLDAMLGYNRRMFKRKLNNDDNSRDISSSVGVRLGFTFLLGRGTSE